MSTCAPSDGADPADVTYGWWPWPSVSVAAVAGEDRLAAEHVAPAAAGRGVVVDGHRAQHRLRRGLPLREVGLAAHEVGGLDLRPRHPGLDDRPLAVQLEAVRPVALLQPAGGAVDADPDRDGAVRLRRPRAAGPTPGRPAPSGRRAPSPARRRRRSARPAPRRCRARCARQVRNGNPSCADVGVGEAAEDVAGPRAPQPDRGERRGLVDDRGAGGQVVGEPLEVGHAVQRRR